MTLIRRALFHNTLVTLVAAVAASEVAILSWCRLASGRAPLGAGRAALAFALLVVLNGATLWLLRRMAREQRLAYLASRAFMVGSLAALFGGAPLVPLFALATLAAWLGPEVPPGARLASPLLLGGGGALLALGSGCVLWGALVGQRRLQVEHVELAVPGLPEALRGLRVAQISDLHIGFQLRGARLRRFVERVNELEPDLIAITGDLFDFDEGFIDEGCHELAKLTAPHGVFAILGNHDHYTGADAVERGLRSLTPIVLLRDELAPLQVRGEPLWLVGIDDPGRRWTERDSESLALQDLAEEVPAGAFSILLAHRPSYFRQAIRLRFPLVLCGHTHGGQIAPPSPANHWNVSRLIAHWTRGAYREESSVLYVNRGLGVVGPPVRLNCPREIALLRLVPATTPED